MYHLGHFFHPIPIPIAPSPHRHRPIAIAITITIAIAIALPPLPISTPSLSPSPSPCPRHHHHFRFADQPDMALRKSKILGITVVVIALGVASIFLMSLDEEYREFTYAGMISILMLFAGIMYYFSAANDDANDAQKPSSSSSSDKTLLRPKSKYNFKKSLSRTERALADKLFANYCEFWNEPRFRLLGHKPPFELNDVRSFVRHTIVIETLITITVHFGHLHLHLHPHLNPHHRRHRHRRHRYRYHGRHYLESL